MKALFKLLEWLLPVLGSWLVASIKRYQEARATDPNLLSIIYNIVEGIERSNSALEWEKKWQMAFDAVKAHLKSQGKDLKTSIVNGLIEDAVAMLFDKLGKPAK